MIPLYISDESLDKQFAEAKKEWRKIQLRGNDTKCWTDGQCMNLIRLKMIRLRKRRWSGVDTEDISGWEIPAKVSFEYNHRQSYKH